MSNDLISHPKLACAVHQTPDAVILSHGAYEFDVELTGLAPADFGAIAAQLQGAATVDSIYASLPENLRPHLSTVVRELERMSLLDDMARPAARPALDVLYELEDLTNELLDATVYQNPFWVNLQAPVLGFSANVLYGFAIENYHFLARECAFDSPLLSFPGSATIRKMMNDFYVDEHGHDGLVASGIRALDSVGISTDALADSVPLPTTQTLCHALTYWAYSDPVFFLSTLGLLEGKQQKKDSFISACERFGLDERFVAPIRNHANINLKGGHANLSRLIFEHLPPLDAPTVERLRRSTRLFIEIYDRFFSGVWEHYSQAGNLIRTVEGLAGDNQ
ncbi:MAG TPA: hypothetical protein VHP33_12370 [Polyangiaceae bacterium]|nr:hypothetical protein [Polyangiaceae bacterium]